MMRRYAFTMLELVFVIVIMGIIGKFGVEFLAQAYKGFIFSNVNHTLQSNSEMAVESIAAKLQFRIKDSIIARKTGTDFKALSSSNDDDARILEWVGADIDGFRGTSAPLWSGIIDIDASVGTAGSSTLVSLGTDTAALDTQIGILAHGSGTGIDNAAIYFVGSDSDINTYGWNNGDVVFTTQANVMHPIKKDGTTANLLLSDAGTFSGVDIFEYYQLAWTAYAVVHSVNGDLRLHYDYQPWEGDDYLLLKDGSTTKNALIMQNVDTFRFKAVGSVVKIQVCVNSDLVEDYSLCKEKTIF